MTAKLGAFRTSMLQDAEAGHTIEALDAIVGAVRELGERVGRADADHRRAVRPHAVFGPCTSCTRNGTALRR